MKAIHRLGANISMDEISDSAGTSKSVFYRYFGDKSGLQLAMADELAQQMQERIRQAETSSPTRQEAIRAMIYSYLDMAAASSNLYFFVTERIVGVAEAEGSFATLFTALEQQLGAHIFQESSKAEIQSHQDTTLRSAAGKHGPKAAIGLIRAAGESWLAEPMSETKPTLDEMTDQIVLWLLAGLPTHEAINSEVE